MRTIGLDIGRKIIGVAISDPTGMVAQGYGRILRKSKRQAIEELKAIIHETQAQRVVVGLPKNMDGTLGEAARDVLKFCEEVKKEISASVETWDERLSTVAAERAMLEADVSRQKRKRKLDQMAATLILQSYLDYVHCADYLAKGETGHVDQGEIV
ncbi:MAG: Holliday junction resolvase RuvX [Firmicutes bacterium]|nr:Holliday junction resolvase RuvX [Bacillota bacterium]